MTELTNRLRHLVSLNETKHGGPYRGAAAEACVQAMAEAADRLDKLSNMIDNALMAYAETHDSDEARARLMAAHLHEDE